MSHIRMIVLPLEAHRQYHRELFLNPFPRLSKANSSCSLMNNVSEARKFVGRQGVRGAREKSTQTNKRSVPCNLKHTKDITRQKWLFERPWRSDPGKFRYSHSWMRIQEKAEEGCVKGGHTMLFFFSSSSNQTGVMRR